MRSSQTPNGLGDGGELCIAAGPRSELKIKCHWGVTHHEYFSFIGVILDNSVGDAEIEDHDLGSVAAFKFLIDSLQDASNSSGHVRRLAGLIIPSTAGYIIHSDIVPLRLVDCEPLETAVSFASPLQYFPAMKKGESHLSDLLPVAVGGFLVRAELPTGEPHVIFDTIQGELLNRLSFPWIQAEMIPIQQRTLVVVEGGSHTPDDDGVSARVYPAAQALGLRLVILDRAGHWLEDGMHNHFRDSFISVELTNDSDVLANNIVAALRDQTHLIGGIVSFYDEYQVGVAKAAQMLSLPTVSPEAFVVATNKFQTSVAAGRCAYHGHSVEDAVAISQREDLNFPVIVKPCSGWMSEGVFKVAKREDLVAAVNQIDFKRHGAEYVVEEYCDGPEVDFNVVVYDGEIMFHEISDDFPKSAEGNGLLNVSTFIEMDSAMPSKLPESEQLILRHDFHSILRRTGLNFGVFHIEGRVKNSSMEFRHGGSGILDLYPRQVKEPAPEPSGFVLDINPRPPGGAAAVQPRITYGIDYHALSMLIALRDTSRVSALSQPFRQGNQYWSDMVYIPTDFPSDCIGIFDSDDICEELKQRRPDLAKHISTCATHVKRGEKVSHASTGVLTWQAYYNVFSRESRSHLREIANEVRRETRYSFK